MVWTVGTSSALRAGVAALVAGVALVVLALLAGVVLVVLALGAGVVLVVLALGAGVALVELVLGVERVVRVVTRLVRVLAMRGPP
ncbi:hypothetical protein AB0M46_44830 [Dactylosporangium sp. NPDC051485]|uniref:hypothetical protein n=1 Tax=Dactylosporangium sp. NPDC051485 TaxID=3154846 RepID=UPI0034150F82